MSPRPWLTCLPPTILLSGSISPPKTNRLQPLPPLIPAEWLITRTREESSWEKCTFTSQALQLAQITTKIIINVLQKFKSIYLWLACNIINPIMTHLFISAVFPTPQSPKMIILAILVDLYIFWLFALSNVKSENEILFPYGVSVGE